MPIDPEKFKQDPRTPQQLAKAILDHQFTPGKAESPSVGFGKQLLMDDEEGYGGKHGRGLLIALQAIAADLPLGNTEKRDMRHALEAIDSYRRESAAFRDMVARDANAMPPELVPFVYGQAAADLPRKDFDSMESFMVELGNLKTIEKLVRALASKLDISLIEPGRAK